MIREHEEVVEFLKTYVGELLSVQGVTTNFTVNYIDKEFYACELHVKGDLFLKRDEIKLKRTLQKKYGNIIQSMCVVIPSNLYVIYFLSKEELRCGKINMIQNKIQNGS
jgi:hypothetical protein